MKFAVNDKNLRIEVSHSGEKAFCPGCNSIVIGNKGEVKDKYWRHKAKECDSWYEPTTLWHLSWQNYFPLKNQEVILKDPENNVLHRADIQLGNGLVIEVQNSPIKPEEI
ncbi:competence protein CoiA family protein [Flavobacterium sp. ZS1P70]|uniref:Competence protein CoiA family protein n=1 Tax=Flavobacterium zhoui TaxID=3230414 RepID=A0ABW6I7F9_9FLAO